MISLFGCLLYQVHIIYCNYMLGKTIIRLEIRTTNENHPAITICTWLYLMERAGKYHHDFFKINNRYQVLIKNDSDEADKLYHHTFDNYTNENLKNNGLDMNELFDNISIKYQTLDGSPIVEIGIWTGMDKYKLPGQTLELGIKNNLYYGYIDEPLETIIFRQLGYHGSTYADAVKCFTYFSYA